MTEQPLRRRTPQGEALVTLLMLAVTVALIAYIGYSRYGRTQARVIDPPLPAESVSLDNAPRQGDPNAPLVLVEYSDFLCPACLRFARLTGPEIDTRYVKTGKLLRVYRHRVSRLTDPLAVRTAEAASCAARQGRFWPMHEKLFAREQNPRDLSFGDALNQLSALASEAGVDRAAFSQCLAGPARADVVMDVGTGALLEVTATPTIFIGRSQPGGGVRFERRITGAIPAPELAAVLDSLLAQPASAGADGR